MSPDIKYLREISRSLINIYSLQRDGLQAIPPNKPNWLRRLSLVAIGGVVLLCPFLMSCFFNNAEIVDAANNPPLGIDSLVKRVQTELSNLEQERREKNIAPTFQLKSVELEVAFVVKKTSTQSGSAQVEVATVKNELQTGSEHTHRLKLILEIAPHFEASVGPSGSQPPTIGQILGPVPPQKGENK